MKYLLVCLAIIGMMLAGSEVKNFETQLYVSFAGLAMFVTSAVLLKYVK